MALPRAIESVRRTRAFSISRLAMSSECLLRFVLENEKSEPLLSSGPLAYLGTSIHKIVEDATRESRDEILSSLKMLLVSDELVIPSAASSSGYLPFKDAITKSQLIKRMSAANQRYKRVPVSRGKNIGANVAGRLVKRSWLEKLVDVGVLVEEPVRSEIVELVGVLDRLESSSYDSFVVEDYKTGSIFNEQDETGTLKFDYRMQLYGYALILSEKISASSIVMKVSGADGTWEEQFDENARGEILEFVEDLQRTLPKGKKVNASEIAKPGRACQYCQYRPACKSFIEHAPTMWDDKEISESMPCDVWGRVTKASKDAGELWDIYVAGANGKLFRINNVPSHLFQISIKEGQRIHMFDLHPILPNRNGYPQNFYVLNRQDLSRSAHTAKIFLEDQ